MRPTDSERGDLEAGTPTHPPAGEQPRVLEVVTVSCPVCDGQSFDLVTWTSGAGAEWPARSCRECGAITKEKHLTPAVSGEHRIDSRAAATPAPPPQGTPLGARVDVARAPRIRFAGRK